VPAEWLGPDTVLCLSLEAPLDSIAALARRAALAKCRIVLNAAPARPVPAGLLDLLDVLIVNRHEATALARSLGIEADTPMESARALAKGRKTAVIATLGGEGAVAFRGGKAWRVPALAIGPAVDTTGAGDAFAGALAAALDAGSDLAPALARAAVAGALACTKEGAQPALPDAAEIAAALPRLPPVQRIDLEMN